MDSLETYQDSRMCLQFGRQPETMASSKESSKYYFMQDSSDKSQILFVAAGSVEFQSADMSGEWGEKKIQ